jgi:hypothetical protein
MLSVQQQPARRRNGHALGPEHQEREGIAMRHRNDVLSRILLTDLGDELLHPFEDINRLLIRWLVPGIDVPTALSYFTDRSTLEGDVYFDEKIRSTHGQAIVRHRDMLCRLCSTRQRAAEDRRKGFVTQRIGCGLCLTMPFLAQGETRQPAVVNPLWVLDLPVPNEVYLR